MNDPNRKTFEYLIGDSISTFGLQMPRQIDILRLYYHFPNTHPESTKITEIMNQIANRYRAGGFRIKGMETIRLKIKRLVKSCKDLVLKRIFFRASRAEKLRQEKFHHDIHDLLQIFQTDEHPVLNFSNGELTDDTNEKQDDDLDEPVNPNHIDPNDSNDPDSDLDYSPSDDEIDHSPKKNYPFHMMYWKKSATLKAVFVCVKIS